MKQEFLLGWGDPICVRQALVETLDKESFSFAKIKLDKMGYPDHYGAPSLIERLKDLELRQSGHRPKHLFITCGATGALNAALHALKTIHTDWVVTNKRYFPIYPTIVGLTDMVMIDRAKKEELCNKSNGCKEHNFIILTDSPSNPEGIVYPFHNVDIWDMAYASSTYSRGGHVPAKYGIACGSLSKTLGLAGLRLGWVSTDEDLLADSLGNYVTATYVGLSSASMAIAEQVISELDFYLFESKSRSYLDDNREEIQKLLTKFGQGFVPVNGMFAILELGKLERKALEKANIKWQSGSSWGETDDWARLSLGQTREITRAAVKAVLK